MDWARQKYKTKQVHHRRNSTGLICSIDPTVPIVRHPSFQVLHLISPAFILLLVLLLFHTSVFFLRDQPKLMVTEFDSDSKFINIEQLNFLIHDLADEGLLKEGHKALILSTTNNAHLVHELHYLDDVEFIVETTSDYEQQTSFPDEEFDFILTSSSFKVDLVDQVVKTGGVVAVPFNTNSATALRQQSNYKIVDLRQYTSTVVTMRKTAPSKIDSYYIDKSSMPRRKLCHSLSEMKKKVALNGLENALLEPSRRSLKKKSKKYMKKFMNFRFLPDLLGDSLRGFKRRVFLNVGLQEETEMVTEWFNSEYPTRGQKFEIYNMEVNVSEDKSMFSDWLMRNLKEEDYVVMKGEAKVVEEIIERRAICLIDELFLECKNRWWQDGNNHHDNTKRAYWECLALYGRLKDEGVAVHQWWG